MLSHPARPLGSGVLTSAVSMVLGAYESGRIGPRATIIESSRGWSTDARRSRIGHAWWDVSGAGGSAGAVVMAVSKLRYEIPEGANCGGVLCDRGEHYLETIYSEAWVNEHFGDLSPM